MFELGLCLLASLFVGWSIGANDAANSIGTAVGARAVSLRQGIVIACVFGTLGALLQGHHVINTVGKGIVPLHLLSHDQALLVAVGASFSGGFWVMIATWRKLPISTSHSVVGAVAGAGYCLGAPVKWEKFGNIFLCWILTPIGAALISIVVYLFLRYVFLRFVPARKSAVLMRWLLVLSACAVAYTWGANDVANATGILHGVLDVPSLGLAAIGMFAIVIGVMTLGYRVVETVGGGITHLIPIMAVSAQIASSINVNLYTELGIPVSTSHSIVGAVLGVGLIRKSQMVRAGSLIEIAFSWFVTPFAAGLIAYIGVLIFK